MKLMAEGKCPSEFSLSQLERNGIWHIPEDDKINSEPHIYYENAEQSYKKKKPANSFQEVHLDDRLLKGLKESNICVPNKLQKYFLPLFINDKELDDFVIHAMRETGKTTTALMTILNTLSRCDSSTKAIIVYPIGEHANQAIVLGKRIAKYTNLSFKLAIRKKDRTVNEKIKERIIIGTPEKICTYIFKSKSLNMKDVTMIVIEDLQLMKGQKFLPQILACVPASCRLIFMSSTSPKIVLESLNFDSLPNKRFYPLMLEFPIFQENLSPTVKPYFIKCDDDKARKELLIHIIHLRMSERFKIAVICKSRDTVGDLQSVLETAGFSVSTITGKLQLDKREATLLDFKHGKSKILITTAAFKNFQESSLKTIINFDMFLVEEENRIKLDMYAYQEWKNLIPDSAESLYVNFVDEKYAKFVFKEISDENIISKNDLAQYSVKCSK